MISIGIDPGLAITGVGIIESEGNRHKTLHHSAITTDKSLSTPERIEKVYNEINQLLDEFKPDSMGIEQLFFNKNVTNGILVSQSRGVVVLAAQQRKIPIIDYRPQDIKTAVCGYGRADKTQVQKMVQSILGLEKVPKPDDVADALAVAICHSHSYSLQSCL